MYCTQQDPRSVINMAEEAGCKSPGQPPESSTRPSTEDGPNTPLSHNKGSLYVEETAAASQGVEVIEDRQQSYSTRLSAVSDLSLEALAHGNNNSGEDETPRSQNTVEVDRVPAADGSASGSVHSGATSQAALRGDDMTSTMSLTTAGDDGEDGRACAVPAVQPSGAAPAASLKPKGVRRIRNPARSPRPRRMRAVDWCPDMDAAGSASSQLRGGGQGVSNATTATSRAVRPGDDPTVNSYATFTTMGEGSILEVDTEDEEGSSSSSRSSASSVGSGSQDGLGDFAADGDGVVDKLPSYSRKDNVSISGTTNHALRPDDQSIVTFATSEDVRTFGYSDGIVDKVPQPSTPSSSGIASVTTNQAVQMADEGDSLATWNTTNTVGLTGNVVDHVPEEQISHHHRPAQSQEEEEGEDELDDIDDDMTVGTSNAIKDEPR